MARPAGPDVKGKFFDLVYNPLKGNEDAEEVWLMDDPGPGDPMASRILAASSRTTAEAVLAVSGGETLRWEISRQLAGSPSE